MVNLVAHGDRAELKMIYVYVIKSKKAKYSYVGITKNIEQRLQRHNSGNNTSTKPYAPFELILEEQYPDYKQAREREKFLKSGAGRNLINSL